VGYHGREALKGEYSSTLAFTMQFPAFVRSPLPGAHSRATLTHISMSASFTSFTVVYLIQNPFVSAWRDFMKPSHQMASSASNVPLITETFPKTTLGMIVRSSSSPMASVIFSSCEKSAAGLTQSLMLSYLRCSIK
jgi:hypothetical protein